MTSIRRAQGFTLVEVVVTLGILALFVGMLGLFPQLMNVSAESANETRAAQIAGQVVRDLIPTLESLPPVNQEDAESEETPSPSAPYVSLVSELDSMGAEVQTVNLMAHSINTAYYSLEGLPVAQSDKAARLKAEVEITPDVNRMGFCQVEVRVQSVGAAATASPYRFFTKIAFPRKEAQTP